MQVIYRNKEKCLQNIIIGNQMSLKYRMLFSYWFWFKNVFDMANKVILDITKFYLYFLFRLWNLSTYLMVLLGFNWLVPQMKKPIFMIHCKLFIKYNNKKMVERTQLGGSFFWIFMFINQRSDKEYQALNLVGNNLFLCLKKSWEESLQETIKALKVDT